VVAELRRPQPHPGVVSAVEVRTDADLYLSLLTIGEICKGVALLPHGSKRLGLEEWLIGLAKRFGDRLLGLDFETAEIWGQATARASKKGVVVPAVDGLIAAQAIRHGLTVATRNVRHFREAGALVLNPWTEA
jgi:predicted nucleic acid-binding protein